MTWSSDTPLEEFPRAQLSGEPLWPRKPEPPSLRSIKDPFPLGLLIVIGGIGIAAAFASAMLYLFR